MARRCAVGAWGCSCWAWAATVTWASTNPLCRDGPVPGGAAQRQHPAPECRGLRRRSRRGASQAITLGLAEILAARELLLVVLGAGKAAILRRALQEPAAAELPASWLQGHPRVRVVCDLEAAAQLG